MSQKLNKWRRDDLINGDATINKLEQSYNLSEVEFCARQASSLISLELLMTTRSLNEWRSDVKTNVRRDVTVEQTKTVLQLSDISRLTAW